MLVEVVAVRRRDNRASTGVLLPTDPGTFVSPHGVLKVELTQVGLFDLGVLVPATWWDRDTRQTVDVRVVKMI